MENKDKYIVWHIQGGLGKNIAATALCADLKRKYSDRKLIMLVSYPEIFLGNPLIDRVYAIGQSPYFYEDYIEDKDVIVFRHEPYNQSKHITKKKHLISNWCDLLDIEFKNQQPILYPNYSQQQFTGLWQRQKPTMVLQTGGGPMEGQKSPYSWTRDMPIEVAQEIVNRFSQQYHIFQITRPNGYKLNGVEVLSQPYLNMELFALLIFSQKRVLIDSCLQHAAAALNLKSTVLWVGTSPTVFGYNLHKNLIAKLPKKANQLIGSYLFDYQFSDNFHECPYMDVKQIFNIEEIIKNI